MILHVQHIGKMSLCCEEISFFCDIYCFSCASLQSSPFKSAVNCLVFLNIYICCFLSLHYCTQFDDEIHIPLYTAHVYYFRLLKTNGVIVDFKAASNA